MRLDVALVALVAVAKTAPCEWGMHGDECQSPDPRALEEIDPTLRLGFVADRFRMAYDKLRPPQTWHAWLVGEISSIGPTTIDYTFSRVPTVPEEWDLLRNCPCWCHGPYGGCAMECFCSYDCFNIRTREAISCPEQGDACFHAGDRFLCGRSVELMNRAWGMANVALHRYNL